MSNGSRAAWCTDISEHPPGRGNVYGCAVLDVFPDRCWAVDRQITRAPNWSLTTVCLAWQCGRLPPMAVLSLPRPC